MNSAGTAAGKVKMKEKPYFLFLFKRSSLRNRDLLAWFCFDGDYPAFKNAAAC